MAYRYHAMPNISQRNHYLRLCSEYEYSAMSYTNIYIGPIDLFDALNRMIHVGALDK